MIILIQISRADFKKYNPKKNKMKSSHFRQKNMTRFRLSPPLTGWIMQPEHCGLTSNKLHPSEHSFAPCFSASSKINGMNGGEPRTFSEQQKRREGIRWWNGSVTPIVQLICTSEKKKSTPVGTKIFFWPLTTSVPSRLNKVTHTDGLRSLLVASLAGWRVRAVCEIRGGGSKSSSKLSESRETAADWEDSDLCDFLALSHFLLIILHLWSLFLVCQYCRRGKTYLCVGGEGERGGACDGDELPSLSSVWRTKAEHRWTYPWTSEGPWSKLQVMQ